MTSTMNAIKPSLAQVSPQVLEIDEHLLAKWEIEVQKGIDSGRGEPVTPEYWSDKHSKLRQREAKRREAGR